VNDTCIKLVFRMLLNMMIGKRERTWDLYKEYLRERYLYVTVQEILEAKGERIA
jgi:hypothetical protein